MGLCLRFTLHLGRQSWAAWAGVSTDRRTGSGLGFRDLERIRFGEKGTETDGDYPGILWKWDLFMYSEIQIASNCGCGLKYCIIFVKDYI